jgi:hypothetical protein
MADTVSVKTLVNTPTQLVVQLLGSSDGTGESAVVKVDKSTFTASDGVEPDSIDIEAVLWNIQGYASVTLLWDHTTDEVAHRLSGSGYNDYIGPGSHRGVSLTPMNSDSRGAGGTGDILLTSTSGATTGTYDITLWLRKAAS